jgi:peptidoglycan hydrolase-like protein with peptidoglycan-binding domain
MKATGTYGPATQKAVKAFQQKNGLRADGVSGATTLAKLNLSNIGGINPPQQQAKDCRCL